MLHALIQMSHSCIFFSYLAWVRLKDLSIKKKKKKATFHQTSCINYEYAFRARPSRCLVAIGKPFCFLFLNSGCGIPKWTQEAISTAQLASQAIIVEKKPMVIFSAGYLNLGLKHTVQWNTCNKRANMQPKNTEI